MVLDMRSGIVVTGIETTLLASLLGSGSLFGIQDPFQGWLNEEIQEAWVAARESLVERQYIDISEDGSIAIGPEVAALMSTWCYPAASYLVMHTSAGGQTETRYFHLSRYLAVEQWQSGQSEYRLTGLESASAMPGRISEIFNLLDRQAAPGSALSLPETEFAGLTTGEQASSSSRVQSIVQKSGAAERDALALVETLAQPLLNGAMAAVAYRKGDWEVAGLGVLAGHNGLWKLRSLTRNAKRWIEATPCDGVQMSHEVLRVMNRVLPVDLRIAARVAAS